MKMDMNRKNLTPYLGLIPVLAMALLIAISRMTIHETRVTEPPFLLPILNTLFLFTLTCIVAYMAMRSYLADGSLPLLMLGSGVLALGTGSLVAGWVIDAYGPDATVTI